VGLSNRAARGRCIRAIRTVAVLGLRTGAALFILVVGLLVLTTFGRDCVTHRLAIVNTTGHGVMAVLSYRHVPLWSGRVEANAARRAAFVLPQGASGSLDGEFHFANGARHTGSLLYVTRHFADDEVLIVEETGTRAIGFSADFDARALPEIWQAARFFREEGGKALACADRDLVQRVSRYRY